MSQNESHTGSRRFKIDLGGLSNLTGTLSSAGLRDNRIASLLSSLELPYNMLIVFTLIQYPLENAARLFTRQQVRGAWAYVQAYEYVKMLLDLYRSGHGDPSQSEAFSLMIECANKIYDGEKQARKGRPKKTARHIFALHVLYYIDKYGLRVNDSRRGPLASTLYELDHAVRRWAAAGLKEFEDKFGFDEKRTDATGPGADIARKLAQAAITDTSSQEIMFPAFEDTQKRFGSSIEDTDLEKVFEAILRSPMAQPERSRH